VKKKTGAEVVKREISDVKMTETARRGHRRSLHVVLVEEIKLKERGKEEGKAVLRTPFASELG